MLHKVLLKRHAIIEHDGQTVAFRAGEHLVAPEIARKLTTETAGGALLEKHDIQNGKVEAEKPAVVEALASGDTPEAATPKPATPKPATAKK